MASKESRKDLKARAAELAKSLAQKNSPEFIEALLRELRKEKPKKLGRPRGSGVDDRGRLAQMERLFRDSEEHDYNSVVAQVARDDPGHSKEATRRRLRRKYPPEYFTSPPEEDLSAEKQDAAEKRRILELAFKEDIEVWDL